MNMKGRYNYRHNQLQELDIVLPSKGSIKGRLLECAPECKGLFQHDLIYEEGKDYEVKQVWPSGADAPFNMAFPLDPEDLWKAVIAVMKDHVQFVPQTGGNWILHGVIDVLKTKFNISRKL